MRIRSILAALMLPLALAACGGDARNESLDALDQELNSGGNGADPALNAALKDQIMVDPTLAQQSNRDAVRPPSQPYAAPVPDVKGAPTAPVDARTSAITPPAPAPSGKCPRCAARRQALTLGGLAGRDTAPATRACAASLTYSTRWALRLPREFPLYPDARVVEAAGNDAGKCALRVVSFTSEASVQTVIDWYFARAQGAGFSADHQADGAEHVLAGTRGDAAYALFVARRADGVTQVDLVASHGR